MATLINTYSLSSFVKINTLQASSAYVLNNLTVGGNLFVSGNTIQVGSSSLNISDPIIYLNQSFIGDSVDTGIVSHFSGPFQTGGGSGYQHTGLLRDHNSKEWFLFSGQTTEPGISGLSFTDPNFNVDTLRANVSAIKINADSINVASTTATNLYINNLTASNIYGFQNETVFTDGSNIYGNSNNTLTLNYLSGVFVNTNKTSFSSSISSAGTITVGSPYATLTNNYTIQDSDCGGILYFKNTSNTTAMSAILPPVAASVRNGYQVSLIRAGSGAVVVNGAQNSIPFNQAYGLSALAAQWSAATLTYHPTFGWTLFGDLA
jgi:hypothetical protein